jgi:hypothetical protein
MERAFVASKGKTLAERLYAAIVAGDAAGGDARGRQSIAVLVARAKGGYGGFTDRAIDLRVDDHPTRSSRWGGFWASVSSTTSGTEGGRRSPRSASPRRAPSRSVRRTMAEKQPAVLPEVLYDLAVIRLAAGDKDNARKALERALQLNPKLKTQAEKDPDLANLK